jgi:hypothetical protein
MSRRERKRLMSLDQRVTEAPEPRRTVHLYERILM